MNTFNPQKAVEVILYLAGKSKDPSFHHIAKLLYFADLQHLERYGRLICGDDYVAMKHGPVPSGVYDLLKNARWSSDCAAFSVAASGYRVTPARAANQELLTGSDIDCLDSALAQYDRMSFGELTRLSHDDAWNSADDNDFISLEAIVERLGNPEGLLDHLQNPDSEPEDYLLVRTGLLPKLIAQAMQEAPSTDWEQELHAL